MVQILFHEFLRWIGKEDPQCLHGLGNLDLRATAFPKEGQFRLLRAEKLDRDPMVYGLHLHES